MFNIMIIPNNKKLTTIFSVYNLFTDIMVGGIGLWDFDATV